MSRAVLVHAVLVFTRLFFCACALTLALGANAGESASTGVVTTCTGRFPNPINDICWRCMLPLSVGAAPVANLGNQVDMDNPGSPICICPGWPPRVGLSLGFWEPIILTEIPRKPFCFPLLGGLEISGTSERAHARTAISDANGAGNAQLTFYHAHEYVFPILAEMGMATDYPCLTQSAIDIAYVTEFDPTWYDEQMALYTSPEAYLFANPIALAACAVDCVIATADLPQPAMFWCAGCQGSLEPNEGRVPYNGGGVAVSLLLSQRLMAKLHKFAIAWAYHGEGALCGPQIEIIMNRQQYKTQMLYPIPNTTALNGKCCQPFGATSLLWGMAKEYPVDGEDFGYVLFRKRNCCLTYY